MTFNQYFIIISNLFVRIVILPSSAYMKSFGVEV